MDICGVEVRTSGAPHGAVLLVSNHVSWLDMVAIQLLGPARFVAKREVRGWPVIGAIADRLGTVYVDRRSPRDAAVAAKQVAALLRAGETVVLFPEGTTTDGSTLREFHASLLQAPIDAGAKVQPVALTYREPVNGLPCVRAAYCGGDGLVESIWRTLSGRVQVRVAFGRVMHVRGQHRRTLAATLHSEVDALRRA